MKNLEHSKILALAGTDHKNEKSLKKILNFNFYIRDVQEKNSCFKPG